MNWNERLKNYKEITGHSNRDIANLAEKSESYVKNILAPGSKRDFPSWVKIMIKMWEAENSKCNQCHGKGQYIDTHPERYGLVTCSCKKKVSKNGVV